MTENALELDEIAFIRDGKRLLTTDRVTECFAHPIEVVRRRGRWSAVAG